MPLRALLFRKPVVEPKAIDIAFDQAVYRILVRRQRNARRYTLRIQAATREVILTMPPRGSLKDAKAFAKKNGGWIAARLRRMPQASPFADGAIVPLRGEPHRIVHRRNMRGTVWVETADDGEKLLCVAGDTPHINRRVTAYLKQEAKRDLEAATRRYATKLGEKIKRISVRDQTSRWGSCSSAGVLSYSWRLILAPPFVLDYLAAHEVTHLREMNHSIRFWRLLAKLTPEIKQAKVWLDIHGADLHRYGQTSATTQPTIVD
jgi:predicted metal-dependent hydrolase